MPRKQPPPPAVDFDALRQDPILFTRTLLKRLDGQPACPHPAQEDLIRGIRRMTVAACGRQFGKSEGLGYYATWYAATKPNKRIYVIAPTIDQARIIFNEIARHFRTSLKSLVKGHVVDHPFPKIILKNGTEIHARGANSPQFIRGKNAHLIICDESAFFKDKTLTDVIEPMMTVTGQDPDARFILISTPFGEGAYKQFFEAAQSACREVERSEGVTSAGDPFAYCAGPDQAWFQFPSSANPHADRSFLNRTKSRYGEDSLLWRTEYLAEFADDDLQVIPWKYIKAAYERYPGYDENLLADTQVFPISPQGSHRYVQGSDLANRADYFVSAIFDVTDPDRIIFSAMERFRGQGWAKIKRTIREQYQGFNHAPTLVDATTLAESVVEDLNLMGCPAEGWKFTNQSKHEIVQELARLFAEGRIAIPYHRDIIDELRYFEYDITPTGVVRMEAKRGHDDIVMAMALAAHLSLLPHTVGFFTAVDALDTLHATSTADAQTWGEPSQDLLNAAAQVPYGVTNLPWTSVRRSATSAPPPPTSTQPSGKPPLDPFWGDAFILEPTGDLDAHPNQQGAPLPHPFGR